MQCATDASGPEGVTQRQGAMIPRPFRIVGRRVDNSDTVTLRLESLEGDRLLFAPGQFMMLGAFGVGEVPISISGSPLNPQWLEHTIRDVGGVTHILASREPGEVLGVRGPFGSGWNVVDGIGGDLILVAGGIGLAPLRPALLEALARRNDFGRIVVLYGARTPQDVLFAEELAAWGRLPGVTVGVTVDCGNADWSGHVGLVTKLIPRASFDPAGALALVCGPEVMMRYVATALLDHGVSSTQLRLSMERDMRCGIGLCGHCQLGELFICLDGPVLSYERLAPLLIVPEL
jgi:NAD(P)H-flavin reductase